MTKRLGYNPLPAADPERLELAFREKDRELGRLLVASALASPDDERVLELALRSLQYDDEILVANALEAIEHIHWSGSGRLLSIDVLNLNLAKMSETVRQSEFVLSNLSSLCDCLCEKGIGERGEVHRYRVKDGVLVLSE